jgi:hypothetical protein
MAVYFLVAAGVVLRRNQHQAWTNFRGPRCLLRCPAKGMQDADDRRVSNEYANTHGEHYREAENERHEERDQDQPPYKNLNIRLPQPGAHLNLVKAASSIYLR